MSSVSRLLARGNGKLGEAIHHFDLPAVVTCPGRSAVCERACYARSGWFAIPPLRDRLARNRERSEAPGFVRRVTEEVYRKGVLVLRLHVSGDFYSAKYAEKWLEVMQRCQHVRYYFYTHSWRVADIAPVLERMARLSHCRAWYSVDEETGLPDRVPEGVRVAYLQTAEEPPERADLVFRVRRLRKQRRLGLPMVCPQEAPDRQGRAANCGSCGHCWR